MLMILWNLSKDDGDGNDNAAKHSFYDQAQGFEESVSTRRWIFHSLARLPIWFLGSSLFLYKLDELK